MLPAAPASIRANACRNPRGAPCLATRATCTDNNTTATILNAVNRYLPGGAGQGPAEGHAVVLYELDVKGPRNPRQPLRQAETQLDEDLDGLVQQQHRRGYAGHISWTTICAQPLSCWFFASMDIVACGTSLKRSLAISLPVTRQTP